MTNIGIKDLVHKDVEYIDNFINKFINKSLDIRNDIIRGNNTPEVYRKSLIDLVRDTYLSNLLYRYVGMMMLISDNPRWGIIDDKLTDYMDNFFQSPELVSKLSELYEFFREQIEKGEDNRDYCKFLDQIISKSEISNLCFDTKTKIKILEKRIFNLLKVDPILGINIRHLSKTPDHFEKKGNKLIVPLTENNYHELLKLINNIDVRYQIETQYNSRTKHTLNDLAKIILLRDNLSKQAGFQTYYSYISRGKHDNTESIKNLISELNDKINTKTREEVEKVFKYFNRSPGSEHLISDCDVIKYNSSQRSTILFNPTKVIDTIFAILHKYFSIGFAKSNHSAWDNNVDVYDVSDTQTNHFIGRLYIDLSYNPNKKITDPFCINLADKMEITPGLTTSAEAALLGNYRPGDTITYDQTVTLFKEFGYVLQYLCYESRVGMVNYDDEFSNYLPLVMEYFAWDRNTVAELTSGEDYSVTDHIIMGRRMNQCLDIKKKCINAKFDHIIHNSNAFTNLLRQDMENKKEPSEDILALYRSCYSELMEPIADMFNTKLTNIEAMAVVQEINNLQGVLYSNLMNDIFAYSTFWIIRESGDKNFDFKNMVLRNGTDNYRELVRDFLAKSQTNCFYIYIKNIIGSNVFDDTLTGDTNYYEEDRGDIPEDRDGIIQFVKV